jgi:hypothetical protein
MVFPVLVFLGSVSILSVLVFGHYFFCTPLYGGGVGTMKSGSVDPNELR